MVDPSSLYSRRELSGKRRALDESISLTDTTGKKKVLKKQSTGHRSQQNRTIMKAAIKGGDRGVKGGGQNNFVGKWRHLRATSEKRARG